MQTISGRPTEWGEPVEDPPSWPENITPFPQTDRTARARQRADRGRGDHCGDDRAAGAGAGAAEQLAHAAGRGSDAALMRLTFIWSGRSCWFVLCGLGLGACLYLLEWAWR